MLPPVHFYLDDSGTRVPDRKPTPFDPKRPNHFSLGGVLVLEEDEARVRAAHAQLCDRWRLTYPLHSVDIRAGAKDFSWLRRGSSDYEPFMRDLTRLRVFPEKSARDDESRLKSYYVDLLTRGLPFDAVTSAEYAPLGAADFKETLIELRFKAKTSPPMQLADLYLWPIAMRRYGRGGLPYEKFREAGTLIEAKLSANLISSRGTKYSCFQLVDESMR